ncbi:hypothetical protein NT6N_26450 [Oceaniferula spumae]|uniref:N-acetylmuramoyl-L-alanine amidase n=1 Tax=Oceaniferula spumae TaxID=2979115 RepID=A0AAT9FNN3_9BACT
MSPLSTLRTAIPIVLLLALCQLSQARHITRVIIDAGHGGKDKGSHRGSVYEKTLALSVAKKTEALLKKKGMAVTMTRRSDVFVSLTNRAAIANRYKNCVFVSIHFNAHRSTVYHGVETYYYGTEGSKLAAHIHLRMLSRLKMRNRDTRQRKDLAVLRRTNCPAVLIECGYISNSVERKRCMSSSYQNNCAQAIADGILAYKNFGK